ncbi:MAG TPA: von Willebrand factor type A domain-containing protein [Opitutaceae bacterium]|nr:von Willebrand factor type A domain-containing protein [Opitutaceae bacterium]
MSDTRLSPDDPRLTAYALGELHGDERAAVEAALRTDPAARAVVEQIRQFGAQLETALAAEPENAGAVQPLLASPADSGDISDTTDRPAAREGERELLPEYHRPRGWGRLLQFPQLYYVVGGVAAACFAVYVAVRDEPPHEYRVYQEIFLQPSQKDKAATLAKTEEAPKREVDLPVAAADQAPAANPNPVEPQVAAAAGATDSGQFTLLAQARRVAATRANTGGLIVSGAPTFSSANERAGMTAAEYDGFRPNGGIHLSASGALAENAGNVMLAVTASAAPHREAHKAMAAERGANRTYYYPGDEKFVIRAQPMPSLSRGGAQPQRHEPFWSNGNTPGLGATTPGTATPAPFAFQLPGLAGKRDAAVRSRLDLAIRQGAPAPFGAFDLLPGPRHVGPAARSEGYAYLRDNSFLTPAENRFSTFSVDVDTASYANVRRFIAEGRLPPAEAVRIEELLNYFPYDYASPAAAPAAAAMVGGTAASREPPAVRAALEVAQAPWAPTHRLVRIGLKARDVAAAARPAANLVFLLDVSGSMGTRNKLPLVKESMRLLLTKLRPDDRVAIVTYAGSSGLALPSTPVAKASDIIAALDALTAGGSTNGGMGIQLAYDIAKANFIPGGINRVILCTDGDFNVGMTSQTDLTRLVKEKAKGGVALTALGFGMGDYQDSTLELLADNGNGNYGYIDTEREAEKLLVRQVDGTLVAVANNVKVQVDFNPARVASYRLIGYEDRALQAGDFRDDAADAGELGAGDCLTALYEIVPVGSPDAAAAPKVDRSRYDAMASARGSVAPSPGPHADELLTVKVRYQDPTSKYAHDLELPVVDHGESFANASPDFKFAAAVAAYGMLLRDSPHRGSATIGDVIAWAAAAAAKPVNDPGGYRRQFIGLAERTRELLQ